MAEIKTLTLEQMRIDAGSIFRAAVDAVDPGEAIARTLHIDSEHLICAPDLRLKLPRGRIFVVGAGKAVAPMALAIEKILGNRTCSGLVVTKDGHGAPLERIKLLEASHPVPDQRGEDATRQLLDLLSTSGPDDLVITLISGGGSALLAAPAAGLSLADKIKTTDLLLGCGADINQVNCVRKHLSAIKGGQLAQQASPSPMLTLVVSDVIGDPLDVIASGPTVGDASCYADALKVLSDYDLLSVCPPAVIRHLRRGAAGHRGETPTADEMPASCQTRIIASNSVALAAAREKAEALGYDCQPAATATSGEAREAARRLAVAALQPALRPTCLLAGGETTVTLKGTGLGGRNQEFALAAARAISGAKEIVILAAGTDGNDGPTDAAGAIVDNSSLMRGKEAGLSAEEHLRDNNSYPFHQATGDLLVTGPTRTNVMDIYLALVAPGT